MRLYLLPGILPLCAALSGCITSGSSGNAAASGNATPSGDLAGTVTYVVAGNRIISQGLADTSSHCEIDSLRSEVHSPEPDTGEFVNDGNTLTLYQKPDTAASGALVQHISIETRIGSGSGLQGDWAISGESYRVVSGTLTAQEKTDLDSDMVRATHLYTLFKITSRIAQGTISVYVDADLAGEEMESWNGSGPFPDPPDSARYDMTAKALDKSTVEFYGRKTMETVRVTTLYTGDITYVSDQPAHAESHYYAKPKSCPDPYEPAWYTQFQSDNLKPGSAVLKSAGNWPEKGTSRHFHRVPLKSFPSLLN